MHDPIEMEDLVPFSAGLAPIIHDGHRIWTRRAVVAGLTAVFRCGISEQCWRLTFRVHLAARAAWFMGVGPENLNSMIHLEFSVPQPAQNGLGLAATVD